VKAVIFDFSGTLFHCDDTENWLRDALADGGIEATAEEIAHYAKRLLESGGQPGSYSGDIPLPDHLRPLWQRRDLDPAAHRAVYIELMRAAGLPWPVSGYGSHDSGRQCRSYSRSSIPGQALETLKRRATPVAVLSNIPHDIRPVFRHYRIDSLVTGYVLSYEEGVKKPDPEIFRRACDLLGHDPGDVLMIGDNVSDDGGATSIGCEFRVVAHLPVTERPNALLEAIA
jgi:FMN phosphatase YigB (HAD superfamily)